MSVKMLRKPPIGNTRSDRLKITLAGNHTLKQKTCMLMQVKFWLQHEQGIGTAGPSDVYLSLLDPNGYPLTYFRDGKAKVSLALAKGRKLYDKRQAILTRDAEREAARAVREASRWG